MGLLSFLGFGSNEIKDAIRRHAVIVDVRPPGQYDQGKIRHSLNIPIDQVSKNVGYIKNLKRPVITCGNGSESAQAKRILEQSGIKEVYNGGNWERLLKLVQTA